MAHLKLPCLGRDFSLGMLYDCRSETLVESSELWNPQTLKSATKVESKLKFNSEVYTENSIKKKCQIFDVNSNLKLSLISDLVEINGSALYWKDQKSSEKHQSRVTLHLKSASRTERLEIEKISSPNITGEVEATHIVTEITYGADAFFVFDRPVGEKEVLKIVNSNMAAQVKALSKGSSKETSEDYECSYYGDCDLSPEPIKFSEAKQCYSELQQLLKSTAIPMTATLVPLTKLKGVEGKPHILLKSSSAEDVMEAFQVSIMQANDLKHSNIFTQFENLKKQMETFVSIIECYRENFKSELSTTLQKARTSKADEKKLSDFVSSVSKSPFSQKNMSNYLKSKSRETDKLSQFLEKLQSTDLNLYFDLPSSSGTLEGLIRDAQIDTICCLAFNVVPETTTYLENMETYKDTGDLTALEPDTKEWFNKSEAVLNEKLKRFHEFVKANSSAKAKSFVVTDQNSEVDAPGPVFILYKNGNAIEFEIPGKPGTPQVCATTTNTVELQWEQPDIGASFITSYCVNYYFKDPNDRLQAFTKSSNPTILIDALLPSCEYKFSVQAVCEAGVSMESTEIKKRLEVRPADRVRKDAKKKTLPNKLQICELSKHAVHENVADGLFKYEVGAKRCSYKESDKVLMVVGATGAGKSTLINGMVNYAYGVNWDDNFRFVLIPSAPSKQHQSQTQEITAYTLQSTILPYSVTIIDTPGFGDTGGIERDKAIAANIKKFFSETNRGGIDHLDGIGFVAQAALPRLTHTQKYIFEAVLAIFGNDISENIFLMCTFADGGRPEVLAATDAAKIPYRASFKFNNSALFASNDAVSSTSPGFDEMFWKMGATSFKDFFSHFNQVTPRSLTLTREVLEEREQHEILIAALQQQVRVGLDQLNQIQQEEQVLKNHEAQINANKDFSYEVEVTKFDKKSLEGTGRNTTTCKVCNFTCHDNCKYPNDDQKRGCRAMSNGQCRVCPKKCHWTEHTNLPYVYKYYTVMETRTCEDLKRKYETAKSDHEGVQAMIRKNQQILKQVQNEVYEMTDKIKRSNERLSEIALRPNPLSSVEYLDLLIETEKMERKYGWEGRVVQFNKIKEREELFKSVDKVAVAPTQTVEESTTFWAAMQNGIISFAVQIKAKIMH